MPFIGNQPAESFTSFATQEFSTSATTSYTLDHAVTNENEIALFVNNVRQQPGSGKAYTASGTALTLSEATASTDTMYCVFLGRALQTVTPATNSVTADMISATLGKIGQVVSTTKTDTFSTTSDSFTDITGLSVAITPSASSSKVLVLVNLGSFVNSHTDGYRRAVGRILRGSTDIASGDAATGVEATFVNCLRSQSGTDHQAGVSMNFLDSPSTTSETTYKVQAGRGGDSNGTVFLNRSGSQDSSAANTVSTITAMEVLA